MSEPLGGLLAAPPAIVAAGVEVFSAALRAQGVPVTDVDWRPPGFGSAARVTCAAMSNCSSGSHAGQCRPPVVRLESRWR